MAITYLKVISIKHDRKKTMPSAIILVEVPMVIVIVPQNN